MTRRVRGVPWGMAIGLFLLLAFPFFAPTYYVNILMQVLIFAILALTLDLLLGYTGMVSFGHAAFFGLGAYAVGIVGQRLGAQLWLTLPAAIIVAGLAALVIGFFSIRASGIYFLMLTLALSQMAYALVFQWTAVTGGSNGLAGIPRPTLDPLPVDFSSTTNLYFLITAILLTVYFLLRTIVRSPFGATLRGIKENESRMRALGYATARYKLAAFVIAGALAGSGGALYGYYNDFVSPSDLYWTVSGEAIVMVIIGGAGTLTGPALGAALVVILQRVVSSYTERWPILLGAIFIAFVLFAPGGIAGLVSGLTGRIGPRIRASGSHRPYRKGRGTRRGPTGHEEFRKDSH
jgi:branched-chain amino acid transport system permease protein